MIQVQYIRQAITANGGTPLSWQPIASLRELVTVYGGTPTLYSEVGLLRQAVTAAGGTPTKWETVAVLRELLVALGQTVTSYQPTALMVQLAGTVKGGGTPPPTDPTAAQIMVVAGQSNSRAAGTSSSTPTGALASALTDIYVWKAVDAVPAFETYQANVNSEPRNVANSWGSEAAFALAWKAANPGVPLYIVKYGVNGTLLFPTTGITDWNPANVSEYWDTIVADVDAAKAALVAAGKTPRVAVFNWCQGEADAVDKIGTANVGSSTAYETHLTTLCAAVRAEMGDANTKIIIERLRPLDYWTTQSVVGGPNFVDGYRVREAQTAVAAADATGKTLVVSTDYDDLALIHPDATWVQHKGERVWAAYNGTYTATYGSMFDTTPNAFAFTDQTGITASSLVTSNTVTPTGYERRAAVSIVGGEYQIYEPDGLTVGTDWTTAGGYLHPYQQIRVRRNASATGSTAVTVVLTIGGVPSTWTITTEAAAPSYQTETTAFLAALATDGGVSMDGTQKAALDAFYVTAKASTWWARVKRLYVGGLNSSTAGKINLTDQSTRAALGGSGTAVSWAANSGWNPANTTNAYLDLQANPSTLASLNDIGFGAYLKSLSADTDVDLVGSDGTAGTLLMRVTSDGGMRIRISQAANINLSALTTTPGFRHVNRSASNAIQVYGPAGTSIASNATVSSSLAATNIYMGSPAGTSTSTADRPQGATWLTTSLTAGEAQGFRDAIVTLLTAFGSN